MSPAISSRPNGPRNLVFISDGTLSSETPEERTNAGLLARLVAELGPRIDQSGDYDRGVQGEGWQRWLNAATGETINLSICRGYGFLASRYQPGDRIYLFGYSRGAYAVRSLAGMIGRVGLLKVEDATHRNLETAFRHYEADQPTEAQRAFSAAHCREGIEIEMLGVWDTVRALGLPYPLLNRLSPMATDFHDHALGPHIRHGYHALAIDEDRLSYAPILWERSPDWEGRLEQTWFPGSHGDVGGEVRRRPAARPLANLSLNWMLRRAASHGLILPEDWETRFPDDPAAPSVGTRRGLARAFVLRGPRMAGHGDGETVHLSVARRIEAVPGYRPLATGEAGSLPPVASDRPLPG